MVTLHDPDGFPINLIHGQALKESGPFPEKLIFNDEMSKERKNAFQRFKTGPAKVHKVRTTTLEYFWDPHPLTHFYSSDITG